MNGGLSTSTTSMERLQRGLQLHQAGEFALAEQAYLDLLEDDPGNADAYHLLGLTRLSRGSHASALEAIKEAVSVNPFEPAYYLSLGDAYKAVGELTTAADSYRRAIRLDQGYVEAHNRVGVVLLEVRDFVTAASSFERALELRPGYVEALINLATASLATGATPRALACAREACALQVNNATNHFVLGNALTQQGDLAAAIEAFQRAIALRPDYSEAYALLGKLRQEKGELVTARTLYRRALSEGTPTAQLYCNYGAVLTALGEGMEAIAALEAALVLSPDDPAIHFNLAFALSTVGQCDRSKSEYAEALRLNPEYAEAHSNLGMVLLSEGNFEAGWREYEWRHRVPAVRTQIGSREYACHEWDGSSMPGGTLFLYAEQGMGDTIMFSRYIPLVRQRVGRVLLECQPQVARLMQGVEGVDLLCSPHVDATMEFDAYASLVSLPRILNTRMETIPHDVPYLRAEPALVDRWRSKVSSALMTVGLVWATNTKSEYGRVRSAALADFGPLAGVDGVRLVSLQTHDASVQAIHPPEGMSLLHLGNALADFADTAAVIACLDLVISVDTAVAHLAGALGKPVWTLLPVAREWRWFRDREDSPWYPTMRLFTLQTPGGWRGLMVHVAAELDRKVRECR